MPKRLLSVLGLAGVLLASSPGLGADFEASPCWAEATGKAETRCGYLLVPEERHDPASRLLRLPVVIFKGQEITLEGAVGSEPILILNGGPGGSAWVHDDDFLPLWMPFVGALQVPASRDVILFSQRGTDNAEAKRMDCGVFSGPEYSLGVARRRGRQTDWRANVTKGVKECRRLLEAEGYPISAYSTAANIADVKDLRAALGLERLAIYGVSYGARLALEVARHAGPGLTRLILDSPSPPEGDFTFRQVENLLTAIHQLEAMCVKNRSCRRHKSVEANLRRLMKRLDARPREIRIRSQIRRGKARSFYLKVDSAVLVDVIFFSFYFSSQAFLVPEALSDALANDFELLARLAGHSHFFDTGINYATNTSVYCQDTPTATPLGAIRQEMENYPDFQRFLDMRMWLHQTICQLWLPQAEIHADLEPEPIAIPALILSGGLDPVTPLTAARSLLGSLPGAKIVFAPEASHATLQHNPCMRQRVAAFLRAEVASDLFC